MGCVRARQCNWSKRGELLCVAKLWSEQTRTPCPLVAGFAVPRTHAAAEDDVPDLDARERHGPAAAREEKRALRAATRDRLRRHHEVKHALLLRRKDEPEEARAVRARRDERGDVGGGGAHRTVRASARRRPAPEHYGRVALHHHPRLQHVGELEARGAGAAEQRGEGESRGEHVTFRASGKIFHAFESAARSAFSARSSWAATPLQ